MCRGSHIFNRNANLEYFTSLLKKSKRFKNVKLIFRHIITLASVKSMQTLKSRANENLQLQTRMYRVTLDKLAITSNNLK